MTGRAHVAVVRAPFLRLILEGTKTAEARLSMTRRPPYTRLETGETIWFKQSGGPFAARAVAAAVHRFELSGPDDVHALRERFGAALGGRAAEASAYWEAKAGARYATIVRLADVHASDGPPAWACGGALRSAWRVYEPPGVD